MSTAEYEGDVRAVLAGLPASPYDTLEGTYVLAAELFPVKYRLLQELDAVRTVQAVVETGAYFGAFLLTALEACPDLRWLHWIDNESYTPGSNDLCKRNLRWYLDEKAKPGRQINWAAGVKPTDLIPAVNQGLMPDLVHVDGDHSYAGCFFDMTLGLAMNPRQLWVDDYGAIDAVTRAVMDFSEYVGMPFERIPTTNGLAVFKVRA